MVKFKNFESQTLQKAFEAWLDSVSMNIPELGISAMPEKEIWTTIRDERDCLLSASDWTQMQDVNMPDEQRELWALYRQELRDIPQAYSTPKEIIWPTME